MLECGVGSGGVSAALLMVREEVQLLDLASELDTLRAQLNQVRMCMPNADCRGGAHAEVEAGTAAAGVPVDARQHVLHCCLVAPCLDPNRMW